MKNKIEQSRSRSNLNQFKEIITELEKYIEDLAIKIKSHEEIVEDDFVKVIFNTNKGEIIFTRNYVPKLRVDKSYSIEFNNSVTEVTAKSVSKELEERFSDVCTDLKSIYYDDHPVLDELTYDRDWYDYICY